MKKQYQRINSQQELDNLLNELRDKYPLRCFIALNFGLRSSKSIEFNKDGDYYMYNGIDDSEETIKHDELMDTFLGKAISKGALYKY